MKHDGLLQSLRRLAGNPSDSHDDAELLGRYCASNDQSAFAALVERHGPLVWGVCWRSLRNRHDAEDAFQATFVVLARSARSIRRPAMLRSWLHGVALRIASRVRLSRRRMSLAEPHDLASTGDALTGLTRAEAMTALDEEIQRLPDRYRAPLILCYLLGQTNDAAASQLGCTRGTIASRLARAKERLRARLIRRGFGPIAALPAVPFAGSIPRSGFSASGTAQTLAHGVIRSMSYATAQSAVMKLTFVAAIVGAAGFGGVLCSQAPAPQAQAAAPLPPPSPPPEKPKPTEAQLRAARLRKLMEDRLDAADKQLEARVQEFEAGRGTLDILLKATEDRLRAALDLADTKQKRIATREEHTALLLKIDAVNKARYDAGRVNLADLKQSEFHYLDAKIALEREDDRP